MMQGGEAAREGASKPAGDGRRHDLDLIVVATLASVIVAHTVLIFSPWRYAHPYSVQNEVTYRGLVEVQLIAGFIGLPIFFAVSGWNALFAIRARGVGPFLVGRAKRLLVPLIVWTALMGPVIKYVELLSGFDYRPDGARTIEPPGWSFLELCGRYFQNSSKVTWAHLYFLLYLAVISVATLPWLVVLARRGRSSRGSRAEDSGGSRIIAYAPLLATVGHQLAFGGFWPLYFNFVDDANHVTLFGLFFALGALVGASPRFERALQAEWWRLGVLGLVSFVLHIQVAESVFGHVLGGLAAWGGFGGALGLARRARPRGGPVLRYLREATLPVYILHNLFTVTIGYVVVATEWPDVLKALAILAGTLATTFAVYHWLVRPFAPVRFFFGMSPPRQTGQPASLASAPVADGAGRIGGIG